MVKKHTASRKLKNVLCKLSHNHISKKMAFFWRTLYWSKEGFFQTNHSAIGVERKKRLDRASTKLLAKAAITKWIVFWYKVKEQKKIMKNLSSNTPKTTINIICYSFNVTRHVILPKTDATKNKNGKHWGPYLQSIVKTNNSLPIT